VWDVRGASDCDLTLMLSPSRIRRTAPLIGAGARRSASMWTLSQSRARTSARMRALMSIGGSGGALGDDAKLASGFH
jgi:hypothetical protein